MKLIPPVEITSAMLLSSSIAEDDHPEWSSGATYSQGQRCIRASIHNVYERLVSGSGSVAPESDPANWGLVSATNRWRAFDLAVGTSSAATDSIEFTVAPGIVNALVMRDVVANQVTVTMTDGGEEVYRSVIDLNDNQNVVDAYTYFFEPIVLRTSVVLLDIPPVASGHITVLAEADGDVSIGTCVVGNQFNLGETKMGVELGLIDYSVKTTNAFGVTTVAERPVADRMTVPIVVENTNLDNVMRMLKQRRARPSIWIGASKYDAMVLFGFARDARPVVSYSSVTDCTVIIEGLT